MIPRRRHRTYKGEFFEILKFLFFRKIGNEFIQQFENKLTRFIGVKHVIATASGRFALQLLFEESGLPKGCNIVFPALSLKSLINLTKKIGYNPVIVDVQKDSLNIDPDKLEIFMAKCDCSAIVATHLFGNPCDIHKIIYIAQKHNALVFEDCAHAFGSYIKNQHVGTFGSGAIFSFETIKNLNTYGGGCLATNSDELNSRVRQRMSIYKPNYLMFFKKVLVSYFLDIFLRSFLYKLVVRMLQSKKIKKTLIGFYLKLRNSSIPPPSLFNPIQAKLGLRKLDSIKLMNDACENIFMQYKQEFLTKISFQHIKNDSKSNYYIISGISEKTPEQLRKSLSYKDIDIGVGTEIVDFVGELNDPNYANAYNSLDSLFQLPCFYQMKRKQINKVIKSVNEIFEQKFDD